MSRLEQAEQRVDAALGRLEAAVSGDQSGARTTELERQLVTLRQEYVALDETTSAVARRLDAAIDRLETVVGD